MANFDLDDIKLIIQSIVISSKDPITIDQLRRDFKENEGREIPFPKLGYLNVLDFLHSLRDTVKVLPNNTITAVESSEQEHLVKLIQNQRSAKRSKKKRSSYKVPSRSYNYTQTQYDRQKSTRQRNQSGALSRARYSGSNANYSYGTSNTNHSYGTSNINRSHGTSNTNYSYKNSDTNGGYGASNTNHRYGASNTNHLYGTSNTNHSYETSNTNHSYGRQTCSNQNSYQDYSRERSLRPDCSSSSSSGSDSFEVVLGGGIREEVEDVKPLVAIPEPEVVFTRVDYSSAITPQLKNNLRNIIKECPKGVQCSELSQLVREKYGVPLNYRKYGFSSMLQLVDCIQGILKFEDEETNDWLLIHQDNVNSCSLTKNNEAVPMKVCERIYEVAKTLNYPVTTLQFDKRYEGMFRRSLCEEVEGFTNIDFLLASIDQKFIRLERIRNDYYVQPLQKTRPDALDVGSVCSDDDIAYPSNMLVLGGEIPPLEPFSDAITPVMEIKMGEVYNPHKFFIISSYLKNSYSLLDQNIQTLYSRSDHLALTDLPVKKGLYVVAPYLDRWHRALIVNVHSPTEVVVFLIDFGTYLKISKKELRFLHEDFASIPRLAMRATLQDIAPLGNSEKFSMEANRLFIKLTVDKELKAYIKKVDFRQQKYLVQMTVKEGDSEVFINKKLVSAGVAEFGRNSSVDDESIPSTSSSLPSPTGTMMPQALLVEEPKKERELEPDNSREPQEPRKSTAALLLSMLNRSR